jgi:predicted dehydrogenase/threonine dehydrogenase-like Zn-dependent dehydrogenase
MKQLIQSARSGKLAVAEVPEPVAGDGEVLVRTRASLISAGTERMIVDFARKSLVAKARARPDLVRKVVDKARRDGAAAAFRAVMSRLDEPLPLGYSAAGEIVALGRGVEGRFRIGQRVAIAGAGFANHAEINAVPVNLVAPVPDDVNDEEACFGTVAAIALHGVRNLGVELGDVGAVLGVGLIGQIAVELLDLAGVRVVALDVRGDRLDLATFGGAQLVWNLADGNPTRAILDFSSGLGCDGVLIAAATEDSAPFRTAAAIARDRGRISVVGMTGTEFPYREFMQKELSLVVSRSYGPGRYDDDFERRGMKYPPGYVRWTEARNLEFALRVMSRRRDRRLYVEQLITHRFDLADAEAAYRLVTENSEPHLGVVLRYPAEARQRAPRVKVPRHVSAAGGKRECVLGVIGAGNFARAVLLPHLKAAKACRLHTVVTRRGATAEHVRQAFGFEQAATDVAAALADDEINAVVIATPHGSHASLAAAALAAGKHVFVEKPLALTRAELDEVAAARSRSAAFFQVGFNRRFAPYAIAARNRLAQAGGKKFVVIRVNAGALPPESAINAAENGYGRILGEVCHFVDLARFLVGSRIASVQAIAVRGDSGICEDLTASLSFADGGLATIAYTALGDPSFAKERIEAYSGGTVVTIEDFRRMVVVADGKERRAKVLAGQDKGHAAELAAFVAAAAAGGPPPIDEAELVETSLATIAIVESLQSGATVNL